MAVLPILTYEDPRLRLKSKRIKRLDDGLQRLIDDMVDTMLAASGVGLAAPQVGVPLRLFVIQLPDNYDHPMAGEIIAMYNAEIIKANGERYPEEGCLSVPGWVAEVKRFETVTAKGRDRNGCEIRIKADGLLAQAFQHEIDHLDGTLFVDLVAPDALRQVEPEPETSESESIACERDS